MSTKQEQNREEHKEREGRDARIRQRVIRTLGPPAAFQAVHVRALWEDHYRINVFIGVDALSAKIAHSYFVQADVDGNIIESSPKIGD